MSTVVKLGPNWPSFAGVKFLFIFGDSYSSIDHLEQDHQPNAIRPLGVVYPGSTWNEEDKPNWVGYLITEYCPAPRYIPGRDEDAQDPAYLSSPLLVYDYARGGDTIAGVKQQIRHRFLPKAGKKPDWSPWSANTSLFVTWVGINDCAYATDNSKSIEDLLRLQEELYETGARNFLFIDVPPIDRSPAVPTGYFFTRENPYHSWNTALREGVETFASRHEDSTVLIYSSHATFTKILNVPEKYGFKATDIQRPWSSVWVDQLHPTSKVHQVIAEDVGEFLGSVATVVLGHYDVCLMPSWYSSWLPDFSSVNFTVPSGLQGRFVSFVLKKSLGHFLKAGQLDARQIESQIGSGFVQINDLELDNEAINSFLAGLPLVLHDGYTSSITARVPWPNPLTSNLGLSLDALHLTFHVVPNITTPLQGPDVVESVASAAETFMQEELIEQEDAALLESVHSEASHDLDNIPGGLDPFPSHNEGGVQIKDDSAGVPLFASLLEKLLARFEFKAVNTEITLVHPRNMSLTLSIAEIRYGTEANINASQSSGEGNHPTLAVSGVRITTQDLGPCISPYPYTGSSLATDGPSSLQPDRATSPVASLSSLDEETQEFMSRSFVSLPPRSDSFLGSASSSLYQSAFSEENNQRNPLSLSEELETGLASNQGQGDKSGSGGLNQGNTSGDVLLSLGSEPLVIRIQTPSSNDSDRDENPAVRNSFKANISMGPVGLACNARQLTSIIALSECFGTQRTAKPSSHTNTNPMHSITRGPNWNFNLRIKGLVALVLPGGPTPESRSSLTSFFARPLTLPYLSNGYTRFYIGDINAEISSSKDFLNSSHQDEKTDRAGTSVTSNLKLGLRCADINASVHSFSSSESKVVLNPILFTDQHLHSQYTPPRVGPKGDGRPVHLPTLTVNSHWATELRDDGLDMRSWNEAPLYDLDSGLKINENPRLDQPPVGSSRSAIVVNFERITAMEYGKQPTLLKNEASISILPLHLLLDIGELGNRHVAEFLHELMGAGKEATLNQSSGNGGEIAVEDNEDGSTATAQPVSEREKDRKHAEQSILKGTDLQPDHGGFEHIGMGTKHCVRSHAQTNFSVLFTMIRVELRCSPPSCHSLSSSGILVADFHRLKLLFEDRPVERNVWFTTPSVQPYADSTGSAPPLRVRCGSILFAFCPVRETIASVIANITSLDDFHEREAMDNSGLGGIPLEPRISVLKVVHPSANKPATMLDVNIPSIYVNLTKEALDGLLIWADDATQLLERITGSQDVGDAKHSTSRGSAVPHCDASSQKANPLLVNISITEVVARLMVPRSDGIRSDRRPFDILTSDLVVSIDLRPGSVEQSIVGVDIMDLTVENTSVANELETILACTAPRHLSSPLKPKFKLNFTSLARPGTNAKETKLHIVLCGATGNIFSDTQWFNDLNSFMKSPPGIFETVIPSEKTSILLRLQECSLRTYAPTHPGALLLHVGDLEFATDIIGSAIENAFHILIPNVSLFTVDDVTSCEDVGVSHQTSGVSYWKYCGYAVIAEITDSAIRFSDAKWTTDTRVVVERINLRLHLCADTLTAVSGFVNDWQQNLKPGETKEAQVPRAKPTIVSEQYSPTASMISSVEDIALRRLPEIGPAPDMINDDLPTNIDYLDESFSAAAGLRELRDEDLDDFNDHDFELDMASSTAERSGTGIISRVRGETVKMMRQEGIQVVENFFESLPTGTLTESQHLGDTTLRIRVYHCNLALLLYDGYDWAKTRKTIEREVKDMRRRLAKFRQLVASGQTPDSSVEEMSTLLFNSVYIGLDQDVDSFEPGALIAAIDEQLNDDIETASQSSWQSLRPHTLGKPRPKSLRVHGKKLTRSKGPSMEFVLRGTSAEMDHYNGSEALVSRTFFTIEDVEILDHIKTSTWRKFLTALQVDSRGNTRETDSSMVRVELRNVRPVPGHPAEEVRLRAKILPLRLYVDQDAVDFLKDFFSFKDPGATSEMSSSNDETFIQYAEVFPVLLKLDYKPRRVDYKALREGRTIELMNFFHFDGAEMTLRHITLSGIMGWPRLFELLNDLWTPDVKATQLVDVISGVSPIRSVVNVGSGVADLVLLPIAQYKKDGRILRGLQKGTTAFFKSTALEAIKLGAKLATGTQVILEQAEGVLGGQFQQTVTTETIQEDDLLVAGNASDDEGPSDAISRYADQPRDIAEGMHSAYRSLRKNFGSAAQTILAVPMEVYEKSGDEGAIRSVIRAVPIAVLKPIIGATEAVSKTLLGLHNTLDSNVRHDNQAKYKQQR